MMLTTKQTAFGFARQTIHVVCLMCALLSLISFFTGHSLAQGPDTTWTRFYGGTGDQRAAAVRQTNDGGYMIAGSTNDSLGGEFDFYLIKADSAGHALWIRTYGGTLNDMCLSAQETTDGGYILAGFTDSFGSWSRDAYVVKTNGDGDTLWTRTYGGNEPEEIYAVRQTSDGGYVLAGHTSSLANNRDVYMIKTDSMGDTLWTRTYGYSWMSNDVAYEIQQTIDSGFILAGSTIPFGSSAADIYLIKTYANGDTFWTQTYDEGGDEAAFAVVQSFDGGYIATGYRYSSDFLYDIYIAKTDGQGNMLWGIIYDSGSLHESACDVLPMPDGGGVVAGSVLSYTPQLDYSILIKVNESGDTLWTHQYPLPRENWCAGVCQTQDGGYALCGIIEDGLEYFTNDIYVIKTAQDLSTARGESPSVIEEFVLHQNYPNPFNASTRLTFDLPKAQLVTLKVYDLLGREVATLVDGICAAGHHSTLFDGSNLPSGIYLYRIEMGSVHEAKKMVLLK